MVSTILLIREVLVLSFNPEIDSSDGGFVFL